MGKYLLLIIFCLIIPNFSFAQVEGSLVLTPEVINEEAAPRAMLEYTLKLRNDSDRKVNIYPILEDLKKETDRDLSTFQKRQYLLTEWISIQRNSIALESGAEISLPLEIDISYDAIPGDYYASIIFGIGSNVIEAQESVTKLNPPRLLLNIKVDDQRIEKGAVLKYYPEKKIFTEKNPTLFLDFNNSGNVDLVPRGNVYLYNKRHQEVGVIEINPESKQVLAGEHYLFELKSDNNLKIGRYRARAILEYGEKPVKEINDTIYIMVITLPFILFFGIGTILFIILLSSLIYRKTYNHNHHQTESKDQVKKIPVTRNTNRGEIINLKSKE